MYSVVFKYNLIWYLIFIQPNIFMILKKNIKKYLKNKIIEILLNNRVKKKIYELKL